MNFFGGGSVLNRSGEDEVEKTAQNHEGIGERNPEIQKGEPGAVRFPEHDSHPEKGQPPLCEEKPTGVNGECRRKKRIRLKKHPPLNPHQRRERIQNA